MAIAEPSIGEITMFGGNFAPRDWAFCDGQLLPIAQYAALFSILGTTYGGDGRTTFALPDLRGRVAVHEGQGPGLSNRPLGQKNGTETNTMTIAEMPNHNHTLNTKEEGNTDDPNGSYIAGSGQLSFGTSTDNDLNAAAIGNTGGNQAQNNMQPYTVVNYIIALQGTFPSRN